MTLLCDVQFPSSKVLMSSAGSTLCIKYKTCLRQTVYCLRDYDMRKQIICCLMLNFKVFHIAFAGIRLLLCE